MPGLTRFQRRLWTLLRSVLENILYYIQTGNPSAFYLCPKIVNGAKFKSNRLNCLAEKISIQNSMQSVEWLLLITLIQVHSKREQKGEWKDIKIYICIWKGYGKIKDVGVCLEKHL